jgi:hypothetical protein
MALAKTSGTIHKPIAHPERPAGGVDAEPLIWRPSPASQLRAALSRLLVMAVAAAAVGGLGLAAARYGDTLLAIADRPAEVEHAAGQAEPAPAVVSEETAKPAEPAPQPHASEPPRPLGLASVVRDVTERPKAPPPAPAAAAASEERGFIARLLDGMIPGFARSTTD